MNNRAGRLALKVALFYVIIAGFWVLGTELPVWFFFHDPKVRAVLSCLKGWGFVLVTGVLLYQFIYRVLVRSEQAESTRQAAEARYRYLFENMNEGVAYCRMIYQDGEPVDFIFETINSQFILQTGLKAVMGKRVSEVIPELRTSDPELFEIFGRVARMGQPEKFERYLDSLKLWLDISLFCPEPEHFVMVFEAINKRKEQEAALRSSEEAYRGLFDRSLDCVFLCDFTGQFLDANPAALNLLGYERAEIKSLKFESLLSADQMPKAMQSVAEIHATGFQQVPLEFRLQAKDGREVSVETMSSLVYRQGVPFAVQGIARDITTRKKVEAALLASMEQFRAIFELACIGMVQTDALTGRFLRVNQKMCDITGYSEHELLELRTLDITPPEDRQKDWDTNQASILGGLPSYRREKRYLRKNGSEVWVNINVTVLRDAAGQPTRTLGAIEDISERKRMETALRTSEEHFRAMFELAAVGMSQTDPQTGQFLRVNQKMCDTTGYSAEEMLQLRVLDVTHPEDRQQDWDIFQAVIRGELPNYRREKRYLRKNGSEVWVNVNMALIRNAAGQPFRTIATVEDITDRKRAEESHARLATAVEQAAESIVITDTAGNIQYVNPAFERNTGYTAAEVLGQNPRILKSGRQDAVFYRQMWASLRRGEAWHGHFSNRRKDGSIYEEDATISPIRDAAGKVINFVAVKRDVTREVELQAQLRQSQKMEAIGQLAGGVAHDFNNILAVIQMQAGMLRLEATDGNGATMRIDYATEIEKSCQRAANLTNQLLLFSRKQMLQRRDHDLNEIITSITKMLQRVIGEHILMQVRLSPTPLPVQGDAGMIDQVLLNLTVNARDAMPKGGPLELETSVVELDEAAVAQNPNARPGTFACVRISDSGCGIAPEVLPRIFEPFYTTKAPGKGTGLGLATVFGIVQQHQGWLEVTSEVGRGTTFRFYLPLLSVPTGKAEDWSTFETIRTGHETILLVEDDDALRESISGAIARLGYHLLSAANGAEAVAVWKTHHAEVRLLLTDLVMPGGISGKELAQQLREQEPKLKVIYVSGYRSEIPSDGLAEGVDFLAKPFEMNRLAQTVRNCLDRV